MCESSSCVTAGGAQRYRICLSKCSTCHLSASMFYRPPEEVWWGLWVMSGRHFQLPDRGQWNRDNKPFFCSSVCLHCFHQWTECEHHCCPSCASEAHDVFRSLSLWMSFISWCNVEVKCCHFENEVSSVWNENLSVGEITSRWLWHLHLSLRSWSSWGLRARLIGLVQFWSSTHPVEGCPSTWMMTLELSTLEVTWVNTRY